MIRRFVAAGILASLTLVTGFAQSASAEDETPTAIITLTPEAARTVIPCYLYGGNPYRAASNVAVRANVICSSGAATISGAVTLYRNGVQVDRVQFTGTGRASTPRAAVSRCVPGARYVAITTGYITHPNAVPASIRNVSPPFNPTSC